MKSAKELQKLVERLLDDFYSRRIQALTGLKLDKVLKRKNPYLYRAIGVQDAAEIVDGLLRAHVSSSEETMFGDVFFEPLARAASGGNTAPTPGADVVVETNTIYRAFAVKSGPAVFNSQSKKKQNDEFQALQKRVQKLQKHFDAVVGYCYGSKASAKASNWCFREIAGQSFWAELTGDEDFYLKIIDAMGKKPIEHRDQFNEELSKAKNRFTKQFIEQFCGTDGGIDWHKIVQMNSGRPVKPVAKRK